MLYSLSNLMKSYQRINLPTQTPSSRLTEPAGHPQGIWTSGSNVSLHRQNIPREL